MDLLKWSLCAQPLRADSQQWQHNTAERMNRPLVQPQTYRRIELQKRNVIFIMMLHVKMRTLLCLLAQNGLLLFYEMFTWPRNEDFFFMWTHVDGTEDNPSFK